MANVSGNATNSIPHGGGEKFIPSNEVIQQILFWCLSFHNIENVSCPSAAFPRLFLHLELMICGIICFG